MPQWRKLHTKSLDSLDINDMPDDFCRVLWLMLPLALDRCGRGQDNGTWVRSKVMPLREDVTGAIAQAAMDWLAEHGMIERYKVDGRRYFWIPTWHQYQGDTRREAESLYPAPPEYVDPYPKDKGPNDYTQEQGKSELGASQELIKSESREGIALDSDADTDANADTEENPPTAGAKPLKPKPKRTKNPTPEAVKVFRVNAYRYPAKSWYDDVAKTVGEDPQDLERWGQVVKAWVGEGWKPTNVRGMLDFYERNEIPPGTGRQRGKSSHRTSTETVEIASGLGPPS